MIDPHCIEARSAACPLARQGLFLGVALGVAFGLAACSTGQQAPQLPPAPITVAKVVQKDVPVQITAIGRVDPYSTVSVRSQISAEVTDVCFKEGQDVEKGFCLFKLDCRPYQASLRQAEANLAKDMAQAANARQEVKRYAYLVEKGYVAREQYEQFVTNAAALDETVKADRALVENSRVQTQYCNILAPVGGRTGSLKINRGNVVKANDIEMVVINQIQPIYVTFAVPEKELPAVKEYSAQQRLTVEALIPGDKTPETGVLTFIDNTVDVATGTITLKGTFPNGDKHLWPGQFVDVVLGLTTQTGANVVPSQAVQTGQAGLYVYVVKPDMTAESRPVTAGRTYRGETVIVKGLDAGETVVTEGHVRLVTGTKVVIQGQ